MSEYLSLVGERSGREELEEATSLYKGSLGGAVPRDWRRLKERIPILVRGDGVVSCARVCISEGHEDGQLPPYLDHSERGLTISSVDMSQRAQDIGPSKQ